MTFSIAERGVTVDTYDVTPQGTLSAPIHPNQGNLDYHLVDRNTVAKRNRPLDYAIPNFFGFPKFPTGTEAVSDLYASSQGAVRTNRQPAPYAYEGVLTVCTSVVVPQGVEELNAMAEMLMPTDYTHKLHEDTKILYNAHRLAALQTAVDIAEKDSEGATALAISHQAPLTGEIEELEFPRSGPPTHDTVFIVRHNDLKPPSRENPKLTAERSLLIPRVTAIAEGMQNVLTDLGIKSTDVLAVPRIKKPTGVGFHIFGLTKENLVSPEGVRDATVIFDKIALANEAIYPQYIKALQRKIDNDETRYQVSPVPAHNQILHMHPDGYAVYGYRPLYIGTNQGGLEGIGLTPHRSVDNILSPLQQARVEVFTTRTRGAIHDLAKSLGYDSYRKP